MNPMNNLIRHITSLIFISLSLSAYPISYSFRGLSETNGLSDLTVSALYKDSVGYLWIGTATSVECFDGFRFKHYPIFGDDEKLKWVNVIAETQGNQILVGNDMGLWRINKESGKLEPFVAEVIKFGVRSLLTDAQGTLYIGSEKGLFVCKNNELEQITINADMWSSDNFIVDLNMGEKDTLWILTRSKLYSMNLSTRKITLCPYGDNDRQDYTYRKMVRIGSRLYLGTMEHGVVVFDISTGKFRDNWIDLGCNVISSLSGDGKDILYVGTDGNGVHFVSVKENGSDYLLTAGKMQDYIDLYARNKEDKKNPYFAPYIAEDLANQPDTLILTCEFDPLRDEGEAYGKRLKEAGNYVEIHRIKDALHGYFALGIKQLHVQESFTYINEFLKEETL